jgi:hypothetical protein
MARYGTIGWNIFDDWGKVITILCMELIEDVCWLGESTLRGGNYIVTLYFFQGYHVWTSTMSLLWRIFTNVLHIIVGQTQRNQVPKKMHFWNFIWCDVKIYLKKNPCHNVLKMWIYSWNDWNDLKFLWIF